MMVHLMYNFDSLSSPQILRKIIITKKRKKNKGNDSKFGPPLIKLSGSAHVMFSQTTWFKW